MRAPGCPGSRRLRAPTPCGPALQQVHVLSPHGHAARSPVGVERPFLGSTRSAWQRVAFSFPVFLQQKLSSGDPERRAHPLGRDPPFRGPTPRGAPRLRRPWPELPRRAEATRGPSPTPPRIRVVQSGRVLTFRVAGSGFPRGPAPEVSPRHHRQGLLRAAGPAPCSGPCNPA